MSVEDTTIEQSLSTLFGDTYRPSHVSSQIQQESTNVQHVLLISTPYDYFLLEEEGRLSDTIRSFFLKKDIGILPTLHQVHDGQHALDLLEKQPIDLVVLFNMPRDMEAIDLAHQIRSHHASVPLVYLAHNTKELQRFAVSEEAMVFDWVFTWQGDGTIFLSIMNCVEDMLYLQQQKPRFGERYIFLVDDDIQRYSSLLPLIYEEIWAYLDEVLKEHLPLRQRTQRIHRRPRVILEKTKGKALDWIQTNSSYICCILGHAEILADQIHSIQDTKMPLQLYHETKNEQSNNASLLLSDPSFIPSIHDFLKNSLGAGDLLFFDEKGKEIAKAHDFVSLEKIVWSLPGTVLLKAVQDKQIQHWLIARTESELAKKINEFAKESVESSKVNVEELRSRLIAILDEHKHRIHQGAVTSYHRGSYGPHHRFTRIGSGALGGKARGLAFMDKLLATYLPSDMFEGVRIGIPRTLVLCTDIYDAFLEQNHLREKITSTMSDDRIASLCMEASLPSTVLGDLRDFCKEIKSPLAVRSSSLLEDALFQPFAGVYASLMLPNASLEVDRRYQELCNAIKYIYASVFFQKAREYLRTTPQQAHDEKMGIVIQEVIGKRQGTVFYPTVSGVARSFNYYPVGRCKGEDGIANLALGLGTQIVDGGRCFRFCPKYPTVPHYSTLDDLLKNSQTMFYAIDLQSRLSMSHQHEDTSFKQLDLQTAEKHGSLKYIASTYHAGDQKLYAGLGADGPRVLDFQPLLHQREVPIDKIIQAFLTMGRISLGSPVEIEFALTLDPETFTPLDIALLQVRSMVGGGKEDDVVIGDPSQKNVVCYSHHALGHGVYSSIYDIVYVKPDTFDLAETAKIVPELNQINQQLVEKQRPYVLIGPGRWGSADPWLGIPVVWSDINGAKLIVETPVSERVIEPSEGSHFFHNMSSLRVGYFTILPNKEDVMNYNQITSLQPIQETSHVAHVQFTKPLDIRINGKTREGILSLSLSKKTKA